MRTTEEIDLALCHLRSRRDILEQYATMKFETKDRHGVQDAESDLRELDSMIAVLEWAQGKSDKIP